MIRKLKIAMSQGMGCLLILGALGALAVALSAAYAGQTIAAGGPTPSPALLVLNKDENALAIVDPATRKVVAKVAVGVAPHEVAASSDGRLAVVTNYGVRQDGTSLSVIDLVAQREIHRVDISPLRGPHGIVFFNGKAWFTAEGSKKIARYDPATGTVDWTQATDQNRTHMLLFAPDGKTIYTANVESNSISALHDEGSGWSSSVIAVGNGPEGMDIAPDGRELWVANSHDGTISIIDTSTKRVTQTIDIKSTRTNRVKFSLSGNVVLVSDMASGDLVVLQAATRKERKRLHMGRSVEGILMAPDGNTAFVALSGDNLVAVLDLRTFAILHTFTTGSDPDGMAWRP